MKKKSAVRHKRDKNLMCDLQTQPIAHRLVPDGGWAPPSCDDPPPAAAGPGLSTEGRLRRTAPTAASQTATTGSTPAAGATPAAPNL